MNITRRPFGRTGLEVSEVAFGAWQVGGQWGPVDDGASVGTLLAAHERGELRNTGWRRCANCKTREDRPSRRLAPRLSTGRGS